MVSTRLMSTSNNSASNNSSDDCGRLPVATRQNTSNAIVNCSVIPSMPPQRHQQLIPSSPSPSASSPYTTTAATSTCVPSSGRQLHSLQITTHDSNTTNHNSSLSTSGMAAASQNRRPPIQLLDIPTEILSKILAYVGYKKIGQIRVVSQKMNDICMHVLNSTFSKLITHTFNRFHAIKASMPRRESARRNHPLACECDIIETCYMRLSLLQMTFGKHIERGHCCFFPGAILDEIYTILNYIKNTPRLERPYRVTDELFDLSTMAMEYFRDRIEPTLPDIAYFNKDFFKLHTTKRPALVIASDLSDSSSSLPSPPQSNMVLRKGIRKIKQGMKIYNNQLSVLRNELRTCKRKSTEQGKQIAEQQKLLSEQQKQTLEYANRLDENDKKNEEMSRKFSTLLQELNKCKTELQYWRSKSPAVPICTSCGQKVTPVLPVEDYQALINQGVKPEDIILNINDDTDAESDASLSDHNLLSGEFVFPDETTTAKLLAINTATKNLRRQLPATLSSNSSINKAPGCGTPFAASDEEKPTTSTKVQNFLQFENIVQPTEMINSVYYNPNQDIVKTKSTSPPTNKDLINTAYAPLELATFIGCDSNTSNSDSFSTDGNAHCSDVNHIGVTDNDGAINAGENSAAYSTNSFYGKNVHKSVIVSPSIFGKCGINLNEKGQNISKTATTAAANESVDVITSAVASNAAEDVTNLYAITSNESKKARRVQKTTRCSTSGGKRSK